MTHKEQLATMLDEAGVDWGYTGGDCILVTNLCKFRFNLTGKLTDVEGEHSYDEYY